MISEAASSGKYVVVFYDGLGLGERHRFFLGNLARRRHIYLAKTAALGVVLEKITKEKPQLVILKDRQVVREVLKNKLR